MEPPIRKSSKGFWIAIVLLSLTLLVSVAVNMGLFMGLVMKLGAQPLRLPVSAEASDEFPEFTEKLSYGEGKVKAVRIPVQGIILREADGGLFQPTFDKIENLLQQIRAAGNDDEVRAIILEVDSPGGGITASDEIYQALMQFKQSEPDRKVVVHMRDLAASGGYYIAMAGDWLIAEPTSVVGSIGVILQALNWKQLSQKIGLSATTIKSGANKDLLNPFEDVPPEQIAILQEMIDTMYQRFFEIVRTGRSLENQDLKTLADGRIFTAPAALQHKLIDEIGYWDDVVVRTREMLGVRKLKIVRYERQQDFFEWISGIRAPLHFSSLAEHETPRMMYLWKP